MEKGGKSYINCLNWIKNILEMERYKMKKKLFTMVLAVLLWCGSLTANAAPQYMVDGAVFDAEWYREQNPDIAAAWPEDVSAEVLYQHYVTFGKNEGRTPYNAADLDPASVLPYQGNTVEVPDLPVIHLLVLRMLFPQWMQLVQPEHR